MKPSPKPKELILISQGTWQVWVGPYGPSGFSLYGSRGLYSPDNGGLFVRVHWVLPDSSRQVSKIVEYSYVSDYVELSIESLFSDSYSYHGHTWNPVEIGTLSGTIRNLPYSSLGATHPFREWPNSIGWNPNYYYDVFWDIGRSNQGFSFVRNVSDSAVTSQPCILTNLQFINGKFVNYYWTVHLVTVITNDGPKVKPNLESPYKYDFLDVNLSIGAVCAGNTDDSVSYDRNYTLRNLRGEGVNTFRLLPGDDFNSLRLRFNSLCEADAAWRRRTGYTCGSSARTRTYVGSEISLENFHLPDPNAIFLNSNLKKINWRELAAKAYSGARFSDINGIAGIRDALGFGKAVQSTVKTIKSIPSNKASALASIYLSFHYGYKLFLADTVKLRAELAKQADRRENLTKLNATTKFKVGNTTYTAGYQVFYDQFAKTTDLLDQLLQISDVQLTLENAWDSVPFSFVLDWFISVGDVLSTIDDYANLTQNHEVICCGQSILAETYLTPKQMGLGPEVRIDDVILKRYDRWYRKDMIMPSLVPSVTINPFNHTIEGAALIISRK